MAAETGDKYSKRGRRTSALKAMAAFIHGRKWVMIYLMAPMLLALIACNGDTLRAPAALTVQPGLWVLSENNSTLARFATEQSGDASPARAFILHFPDALSFHFLTPTTALVLRLIGEDGNGSIELIDVDSGADSSYVDNGGHEFINPISVAVAPDGLIAVGSAYRVSFYRQNGNALSYQGTLSGADTQLGASYGVAFGHNGEVAVTNSSGHSVLFFKATDRANTPPYAIIAGPSTSLIAPTGITFAPDGSVVVGDAANAVLNFAPGARGNVPPKKLISGPHTALSFPLGIAVDQDGTIFVANRSSDSVTVFKTSQNGDAAPARVIRGSDTSLSFPVAVEIAP